MYRCMKCGREFRDPVLKQKPYLRIFMLTLRSQWDKSIGKDSVYAKHCPYCDASEEHLQPYRDPTEYDDDISESAPGNGEGIGEENGLHV